MVVAAVIGILAIQAAVLLAMGRVPICTCGYVKLWHGVVHSSENSQHIFDWYPFTHVVHGFGLYFLTWLIWRRVPLAARFLLAVLLEGAWEIIENSDLIINRYRTATIALSYFGDSVVNSLADMVAMMFGFALAQRLPVWGTITLAVALQVMVTYLIRDGLLLNAIMLIHPSEAIKAWQSTPPLR